MGWWMRTPLIGAVTPHPVWTVDFGIGAWNSTVELPKTEPLLESMWERWRIVIAILHPLFLFSIFLFPSVLFYPFGPVERLTDRTQHRQPYPIVR